MGEIRAENEDLAWYVVSSLHMQVFQNKVQTSFEFHGHPCLAFYPAGFKTVVGSVNGNFHQVTPLDHLETPVGHVRGIDSDEDCKMLDIPHMGVCRAVDMRGEATGTREFVIYSAINQSIPSTLVAQSCRTHSSL
jgi:hypothetical protein